MAVRYCPIIGHSEPPRGYGYRPLRGPELLPERIRPVRGFAPRRSISDRNRRARKMRGKVRVITQFWNGCGWTTTRVFSDWPQARAFAVRMWRRGKAFRVRMED